MTGNNSLGASSFRGDSGESSAVLEVDHLSKTYSAGTEAETFALRDVSFEVSKGDFVAIIGPSGSGKSTLLNLIGALDRPTSGRVLIDGTDLTELGSAELARVRNRKIGFVFQSFNLIQRMTALQNVEVPLLITEATPHDRQDRAMVLLEKLGMAEKAHKKPTQLSGGEQQRVAVARSLAADPAIVLGDEPTGNLDTRNTQLVVDILEQLNRDEGKTIVLITHNLEVAARTRRMIRMRDGKIEGIQEN